MIMELTCSDELTVSDLKTVCKQRNIGGYSGLKKAKLVDLCCGKKEAPSRIASSEQTCKSLLTTAIIAGKLQNNIMEIVNTSGKARIALKEGGKNIEISIGETIGLLGDAAMNMKTSSVLALKRYNNEGCYALVDKDWENKRIDQLEDISTRGEEILDKMDDLASKIEKRFRP